jgi:hypothetical protein
LVNYAGINFCQVAKKHGGGGTMLSFIMTIRALGQLELFQNFEIKEQQLSPLQLAKLEQKKRQRASSTKDTQIKKPKSDW